jgi:putative membrane protein
MRWVHLTIVVLFVAAIIVFVIQNREVITMAFLGFSIRAPLALVAAGAYVLGAITGGVLFALLRRSIEGAQPAATTTSRR